MDWVKSGDMASVEAYEKETCETTMLAVRNLIDFQLFMGLVSGVINMSKGKDWSHWILGRVT
eukprot:scaffold35021_cov160-Amphora_coffeaeformis.AAC.1